MAEYTVKDEETGKTVTFNWEGDTDPTDDDFSEVFAAAKNYETYKGQQSIPQQVGESVKKTIGNIPRSAGEMVGGLYQAVRHPVDTATALGKTAMGGVSKLYGGGSENEQYWDAMTNFFKERYGGLDNLKNTIETDPVGFAADISTFLGGAGLATKVGTAGKMGQGLIKAGRAIDPLTLGMKGIQAAGKVGAKGLTELTGLTTGAGAAAAKEAVKSAGTKPFTNAMRGATEQHDILTDLHKGMAAIREERRVNYQNRLKSISANTEELDITPIQKKLDDLLQEYNIKTIGDQEGKVSYDFSRSKLDKTEVGKIESVINDVKDWGTQVGDNTPIMLDTLKQRLDDFYSQSKNSSSFVQRLKGTIKDVITKEVPAYADMTKEYSRLSDDIKSLETALSLKDKNSVNTALSKLTNAMKQNNQYRLNLIGKLQEYTGRDVLSELAGLQFNPLFPQQGGFGRVITGMGFLAGGAVAGIDPAFAALLSLGSPRVVGEFLNVLGIAKKGLSAVQKATPPLTGNILYQAGRAKQQSSLYRDKQ